MMMTGGGVSLLVRWRGVGGGGGGGGGGRSTASADQSPCNDR